MKYTVKQIPNKETRNYILHHHYAQRRPSISYAYGLFEGDALKGICTYGSPPSPSLCKGICGEEYRRLVVELNRLFLEPEVEKNSASFLIGKTFKMLPKPKIIVSYADTSWNHAGYIYQATNFIYTGLSDKRTEWRMKGTNLHSKTVCELYDLKLRKADDRFHVVQRPRKHRYIYFLGSKEEKKELKEKLRYPISSYPKTENKKYDASYKEIEGSNA